MNLEDLAKRTISEISSIMQEQKRELTEKEDQVKMEEPLAKDFAVEEVPLQTVEKARSTDELAQYPRTEELFLKHLRERILVLFEGLNSIKEDELENKLNLTINFLEFLLANIEDKLKK